MRDLAATNKNEIDLYDNLSGTTIRFFYRTPTSKDRLSYRSAMLKELIELQNMNTVQSAQLDYVIDFISGFSDDSFSYDGKAISSDPEAKNYKPDWKIFLKENAADLLLTVCRVLFDEPNYVIKKNLISMTNSGNGTIAGTQKKKKNT